MEEGNFVRSLHKQRFIDNYCLLKGQSAPPRDESPYGWTNAVVSFETTHTQTTKTDLTQQVLFISLHAHTQIRANETVNLRMGAIGRIWRRVIGRGWRKEREGGIDNNYILIKDIKNNKLKESIKSLKKISRWIL